MDPAQVRAMAERQAGYLKDETRTKILVAAPFGNRAADLLFQNLREEIHKRPNGTVVLRTGSFGLFNLEPVVVVAHDNQALLCLGADPDAALLAAGPGRHPGRWYDVRGGNEDDIPHISSFPALRLQNRVVLRNCGWITPYSLPDYIVRGNGFSGLHRVLCRGRLESLDLLASSAFEDRIRVGSSPLQSWIELGSSKAAGRPVLCNAAGKGAGGKSARFLLENDPLSILEGLLLSACLAEASRCILCLEAGSPVAGKMQAILGSLRDYGLIGRDVLGTSFCGEIEIREVPADMRAGQFYAALEAIGEGRAVPPMQPECPVFKELPPSPALVLDPESAAFLAALFVDEETSGAGFEADRAQPSRVVSLSGSVVAPIMAEIPCGISIERLIEEVGGGVPEGQRIAAVQVDAPGGGWVGPQDLGACAHCLTTGGGGRGDGDLDVLDTGMDVPAVLAERMSALQDQSCGICLFCFEGSRQSAWVLEIMAKGNGAERERALLREIAEGMETGCRCALGRSAARFLRSAEEAFFSNRAGDVERGLAGRPEAGPDVSSNG